MACAVGDKKVGIDVEQMKEPSELMTCPWETSFHQGRYRSC